MKNDCGFTARNSEDKLGWDLSMCSKQTTMSLAHPAEDAPLYVLGNDLAAGQHFYMEAASWYYPGRDLET